jgi:hypothetical protein
MKKKQKRIKNKKKKQKKTKQRKQRKLKLAVRWSKKTRVFGVETSKVDCKLFIAAKFIKQWRVL